MTTVLRIKFAELPFRFLLIIAEGMERDSKKETVRFLHIAKGSCAEVRTQLLIAIEIGYLGEEEFHRMKEKAESISRMLHGLIKSVSPNP